MTICLCHLCVDTFVRSSCSTLGRVFWDLLEILCLICNMKLVLNPTGTLHYAFRQETRARTLLYQYWVRAYFLKHSQAACCCNTWPAAVHGLGLGSQLHAQLVAPWLSDPIHLPFEIPCLTQRYEHKQPKQIQPPPADQISLDSISPHDLLCAGCEPTSQGRTHLKSCDFVAPNNSHVQL